MTGNSYGHLFDVGENKLYRALLSPFQHNPWQALSRVFLRRVGAATAATDIGSM